MGSIDQYLGTVALLRHRYCSDADATELAGLCSGHSLRARYCTASAMAGVRESKARRRSHHRSAETFAGYVRAAEEWTDSGLKGVGF